jgi:uncharacterized protein (TIGR02996 family)
MTEEDAFISEILASPRDDAPRLVFADWLEERGDPRGEFLRVSVRLEALSGQEPPQEMKAKMRRVREAARLRQRLRELREVVPLAWALRLSRGWIEQCNIVGWGDCPRRWEKLRETDEPTVRHCGHCSRNVWYCLSTGEVAQAIRSGHPIVKALAMAEGV